MTPTYYWSIPKEWAGETAVILGGGPSLTPEMAELAKRYRRIAVNDAGLVLAPDADAMCWGDSRWYKWNKEELHKFVGRYMVTWRPTKPPAGRTVYKLVQIITAGALATQPNTVVANNTGMGAMNIAFHFGVRRILLLGFDMKPRNGKTNWHFRHKEPSQVHRYKDVFIPAIERMGVQLKKKGIEVVNCTPDSALKCFPHKPIEQVIAEDEEASEIQPPKPIVKTTTDVKIGEVLTR